MIAVVKKGRHWYEVHRNGYIFSVYRHWKNAVENAQRWMTLFKEPGFDYVYSRPIKGKGDL